MTKAWGIVADRLGVEPAQVQEVMWDIEKTVYANLGHKAGPPAYVSSGVIAELGALTKDQGKPAERHSLAKTEKQIGKRFREVSGNIVFEHPPVELPKNSTEAERSVLSLMHSEPIRAFGKTLFFNNPDPEIARKFGLRDNDPMARVKHATRKGPDRKEYDLQKLYFSSVIPNTVKRFDYVPRAAYAVVVTVDAKRTKVSVGSNPWARPPRAHDISKLCERYGGGGHPVVGAVSLPTVRVPDARRIAGEIAAALRSEPAAP